MLDRNELAALKSIADDLAAYTLSEHINMESRVKAEKKFRKLTGTGEWEQKRAHYA